MHSQEHALPLRSPSADSNMGKEKEQVDKKPPLSSDSVQELIKEGVLL